MTILTAIQAACVEALAIDKPDSLFSGSIDRTRQELAQTANAAARHIVPEHDWQALKKIAVITGDGVTAEFAVPADYDRMIVSTGLWSSRLSAPLCRAESDDEWLSLLVGGNRQTAGTWTMFGSRLHIMPTPAAGETVRYFYVSAYPVIDGDGSFKPAFVSDDDRFRLDEELLKLAIVWMFKQSKGLEYAEDKNTYEKYREQLVARDKGSTMIRIGATRMPLDAETAYPFNVGV